MRSEVAYGFLAPPTVFIVLSLIGALAALVWRRAGVTIVLAASLCLFVLGTPAFSSYLVRWLEAEVPQGEELTSAQAIVVLGADVSYGDRSSKDQIGPQSLERLVLAADAYRRLRLPVLVSGGQLADRQGSLAALMKATLEQYFAVPVKWTEDRSETTYQNAVYTVQLLRRENIRTVVLVAQGRDQPRALWSFDRVGLRTLPWPAPRTALSADQIEDFLPTPNALNRSFYALHEVIGLIYYKARY